MIKHGDTKCLSTNGVVIYSEAPPAGSGEDY